MRAPPASTKNSEPFPSTVIPLFNFAFPFIRINQKDTFEKTRNQEVAKGHLVSHEKAGVCFFGAILIEKGSRS